MTSNDFPRLVGHLQARQTLAQAVRADRFGGTLLLTGPAGCGRHLLAVELAKALNCKAREAGGTLPCGTCGPCGRVERGRFPDLLVVQPGDNASGSIGIDQVRELLDELALAPVEGRRRVFVIDPASALTEPAQHALLKGLEEPPQRAVMILIAEREDELLDTVVSRCRILRLQPLSAAEVQEGLAARGLAAPEAEARARWSGGSLGRALHDDALALGQAARDALRDLSSGAAWKAPMELVDRLAGFVDDGADTRQRRERLLELLRLLARGLRDALALQAGLESRLSGAEEEVLGVLARRPSRRLEAAVDLLVRLEEEVSGNVNPTLVLEGLVLDLGQALAPAAVLRTGAGR